jgi:hypothetical protein
MTLEEQVIAAAEARAAALAAGDAEGLLGWLHQLFRWTSHTGASFDRDTYVAANTGGTLRWNAQLLTEVEVVVVGDTAVLRCLVTDQVERGQKDEEFRMPMTQTWIRDAGRWLCLAGHAGPRLPS